MADSKQPLVSIVVLNWNGLGATLLCLHFLKKLKYSNVEIILVDNGSSPDEKLCLSRLKGVNYIDLPSNTGFTGGHIEGLKHAAGEFILLLNNDAVIKSDYLDRVIPIFEDAKVSAVGGRAYFWDEHHNILDETNPFYSFLEVNAFSGETVMLTEDSGENEDVNTVSGSAVTVRKSVIDEVGYLFEPFFAYYEETDLFARMKRAGYRIIYTPKAHIWHQNGASSGAQEGSVFFFYHIFRNRFIFAFRNFEWPYLRIFIRAYVHQGLRSILNSSLGATHKRISTAYSKALFFNMTHLVWLIRQRKTLANDLTVNKYCERIYFEQTKFTILSLTDSKNSPIERKTASSKDERISILYNTKNVSSNKNQDDKLISIIDNNIDVVSVAIAGSSMPWVVIGLNIKTSTIENFRVLISTNAWRQKNAFIVANAKGSLHLAITKKYLSELCPLPRQLSGIGSIVEYLAKRADLDNTLYDENQHLKSIDTKSSELAISHKCPSTSRKPFYRVLLPNRLLRQFKLFSVWIASREITLRLKMARIKNLFLFTLCLKNDKLALELQHIRNEARRVLGARLNNDQLKMIGRAKELENTSTTKIPLIVHYTENLKRLIKLMDYLRANKYTNINIVCDNSFYNQDMIRSIPNYQLIPINLKSGYISMWQSGAIRAIAPDTYYFVVEDTLDISAINAYKIGNKLFDLHRKYPKLERAGISGVKIKNIDKSTRYGNDAFGTPCKTNLTLFKPFVSYSETSYGAIIKDHERG